MCKEKLRDFHVHEGACLKMDQVRYIARKEGINWTWS